jgi:dynein heavy chain 1, cytosolic
VKKYEEAVQDAIEKTQLIEDYLTQLSTCPIVREVMQEKLNLIQRILDDFNFNDYSNLIFWVEDLEERIRAILIKRLEDYVQVWINEFNKYSESGGKLINYKTVLEVKIQNQTIVLDPPISEARAFWYKRFHEQLEVICGLQRVDAHRYEKFSKNEQNLAAKSDKTYKDLILKMNQDGLNFCYSTLEKQLNAAEEYVKTWKSYQTLWDIEAS